MKLNKAFRVYCTPRLLSVFFLGISCGLPISLLAGSLSYWLLECGLALSTIGAFNLLRTPMSLKFLWAPLVDRIRIPYLSRKLGKRRAWGLLFQAGMMASIFGLSVLSPEKDAVLLRVLGVITAFFIASQDIVVDALRIETVPKEYQGQGAASYQMGYRLGMLVSSAGGLWLASAFGWNMVYFLIGLAGIIGMMALLLMPFSVEDEEKESLETKRQNEMAVSSLKSLTEKEEGAFVSSTKEAAPEKKKRSAFLLDLKVMVINPFKDFVARYPYWFVILLFVVTYKLSNAMLGNMAGMFYRKIGFDYLQIAGTSNLWGTAATILGTVLGGVLVMRKGVMKTLMILGFVEILTSVGFMIQALLGANIYFLAVLIAFDNIVGGMGTTAFVAYLSGLCSPLYVTTQYALLSSIMTLPKDFLASFSGYFAEQMGWPAFFLMTGALMLPSLGILYFLMKKKASALFEGMLPVRKSEEG